MNYIISLFLIVLLISCQQRDKSNELTKAEQDEGWELLFDGKSLSGWHLYNKGEIASAWEITEAGELFCNPESKAIHGDLTTDESFEDFELTYDWKIGKSGNSGVIVNVAEEDSLGASYMSGPEMQLLDNEFCEERHKNNPTHLAGALYELKGEEEKSLPKPFGEWNQSRIVQQDGMLSFWLNGIQTVSVDLNSKQWEEDIAGSNFKNWSRYGKQASGRLALQDHGDEVYFRDMRIRRLTPEDKN